MSNTTETAAETATVTDPVVSEVAQSLVVKTIGARIDRYVSLMAPGKGASREVVDAQQKLLYNVLYQILTIDKQEDFVAAFGQTLRQFSVHGDSALSPRYVARGHATVKLDAIQRTALAAWTNVFMVLSRPRLRKSASNQVDWVKAFSSLPEQYSARAREHIKALLTALPS